MNNLLELELDLIAIKLDAKGQGKPCGKGYISARKQCSEKGKKQLTADLKAGDEGAKKRVSRGKELAKSRQELRGQVKKEQQKNSPATKADIEAFRDLPNSEKDAVRKSFLEFSTPDGKRALKYIKGVAKYDPNPEKALPEMIKAAGIPTALLAKHYRNAQAENSPEKDEPTPRKRKESIEFSPAKYAKGKMKAYVQRESLPTDKPGWTTKSEREQLIENAGGKYSNRERAFIISPAQAKKIQALESAANKSHEDRTPAEKWAFRAVMPWEKRGDVTKPSAEWLAANSRV